MNVSITRTMSQLTFIRTFRACTKAAPQFSSTRHIFTTTAVRDDDNNEESKKVDAKEKQKEVKSKLQELLLTMRKESKQIPSSAANLAVPKPRVKAQAEYRKRREEYVALKKEKEKQELGNRLAEAAGKVAETLKGDVKKTENELLELYLYGDKRSKERQTGTDTKENLSDVLKSMKKEKEVTRADRVYSYASNRPQTRPTTRRKGTAERINIFGELPFNIFTQEEGKEKPKPPVLHTWNYLHDRDLRLSVTHPPNNIFEQMILWTEQGKIWKFPIDNEQGLDEEAKVDFTEHVFLERWLEPWCPKSGPIRHFMELVCTGLSKNPYYTVEEKKAHIFFYEHYFRHKNALIEEIGLGRVPEHSEGQISAE